MYKIFMLLSFLIKVVLQDSQENPTRPRLPLEKTRQRGLFISLWTGFNRMDTPILSSMLSKVHVKIFSVH
jgi:hypothetical protein